MDYLNQWIKRIEALCLSVSVVAVLAIMSLTCVDVVLRKLFSQGVPGLYEITQEYFMVGLVFLSMSYVYRQGVFVNVTLFLKYIPKGLKPKLDSVLEILALMFFGVLAVFSWDIFIEAWRNGETSSSALSYPMAPAYLLVPLGSAVTTLRALVRLLSPSTRLTAGGH